MVTEADCFKRLNLDWLARMDILGCCRYACSVVLLLQSGMHIIGLWITTSESKIRPELNTNMTAMSKDMKHYPETAKKVFLAQISIKIKQSLQQSTLRYARHPISSFLSRKIHSPGDSTSTRIHLYPQPRPKPESLKNRTSIELSPPSFPPPLVKGTEAVTISQ